METDRAEADQERIAIDSQLSDLSDSAKRRPVLAEAWNKLRTISEGAHAREADLEAKQKRHAELAGALNDLLEARAARQHALEAQLAAVALETTRWSDYYAARLARARTECDITNPTRSTRRKQ